MRKRTLTSLLLAVAMAWLPGRAQQPSIRAEGIVNTATGRSLPGTVVAAPGSILTIYGSHLANEAMTAPGFPSPRNLAAAVHKYFLEIGRRRYSSVHRLRSRVGAV